MIRLRSHAGRAALLGGFALAAVLAAGCSPDEGSGDEGAAVGEELPSETETVMDPEAAEDEGDGDSGDGDSDAEVDEVAEEPSEDGDAAAEEGEAAPPDGAGASDAEPLVSATNATGAVLSITRLDRVGDVVVLGYDIDNRDGDDDVVTRFIWARESGTRGNDLDQPYLLDESNLVRYRVLRDEDGECLCTRLSIGGAVEVGEAMSFNSGHPAPPADVSSVSVVFPGFPPFADVPISDS